MFLTVSASDHSIGSGFSFPAHQGGKGGFCPARELPPRARRIRDRRRTRRIWVGTTSACAENTPLGGAHHFINRTTSACAENTSSALPALAVERNYLRVRGEYTSAITFVVLSTELPPRARRILAAWYNIPLKIGTTSACAENTPLRRNLLTFSRNYLRVRGEYTATPIHSATT